MKSDNEKEIDDFLSGRATVKPIKKESENSEKFEKFHEPKIRIHTLVRKTINVYRRAFSELNMLQTLEPNMQDGHSYHCISGGDVDSLTYLKHIIKQQTLDYCLFSTWCMADDDILQFEEWLKNGNIKRLDAYCGEIFPGSYKKQWIALKDIVGAYGGRVCIFRNHSKIYAGTGEKFNFAIESSANINTNPRTENTCITIGDDIYHFYKDFFDGIKSFNRDFDTWEKWEGTTK
jgi:hypothetical protein